MKKERSNWWIPAEGEITDKLCEKCNSPMVIRHGKFGDFLACSAYPECKKYPKSQCQWKWEGHRCFVS